MAVKSMIAWILTIATVAGLSLALGILFGTYNTISNQLSTSNGTIAIPQDFVNAMNTAQSFAGIGIIVALAVAVVGLAMLLVYVVGGGLGGRGE